MHAPSVDHDLHDVAARFDLLQHPFYQRWAQGSLTRAELAYYALQYGHVVRALPRWLQNAAGQDQTHEAQLRTHAAEEATHVRMWDRFAQALGCDETQIATSVPNAATAAFIATGDDLTAQGHGPAVVWSIEAQSPAVSAEKLRGLRAHYGIDVDNGGGYFAVHQELDREHEAALRCLIGESGAVGSAAAPSVAASMLAGMWDLLTAAQAA
ncbi:MAG: iron-containing redox enzyme family protein [Candidatus Eremiobacteraeota bacterium]|nr:iron-containing redox enzyme family protein [Candidatus Eremiobacteraeota bacterium]